MATKVAVLLGFSLWGLQPPRVRSQLGVGLSSFLPNRGLAKDVARWGGRGRTGGRGRMGRCFCAGRGRACLSC